MDNEQTPHETTSDATVDSDRRDAAHEHRADRPPTPEEEALADELELDPEVAPAYKEQAERGAGVEGEGRI
ncbi:MAG TPA: hypothetical protein VFI47_28140 [Acidimicrobiales bacterium]|nr:hypothetical protein [Acidimicrobiales bacterium]